MKSTKKSAKPAALSLSVQYAVEHDALPTRSAVRRWVRAAAPGAAEITVRFVGAAEGRALNAQYRGKDYATNVLSFPYAREPVLCGDLVLCLPVVLQEAASQGKTAAAHFAHLAVHGMLHLQGYDHGNGADARIMEDREREILARLGYSDPY
ncbi:MAG: rRNA maturation RNase YbeY [Betaproteobacteria bacterium]|nr:rRNA maturation RNase YbeY [Betaproteobacteria bacterium]